MAGEEQAVDIQEFARLDLRVGTIIESAAVEGSDKLVMLKVDIGSEIRTVVAGIRASNPPESLPGKKVVLLANLKKAKIRGIESNGMILAADGPDGISVISPGAGVENGVRVR
ncbi:MAG TPA: hypothetical protein PLQ76_08670 [bacterium]|nr:hypothetical protein [bacterium]